MRVLVTGGSGFIGRQLVRRLKERGDDVSVVDLLPYGPGDVPAVVGDLRDPAVVEESLGEGVEGVVHLAALTSVLQSVKDAEGTFRTNVVATELLLERARAVGCGRFVLASTNAVIGDVGRSAIHEQLPLHPLTPYGATKAAAEMLLSAYGASYGLLTVALRLSNVYGVGMQVKDSIVARMMKAILGGRSIQIYGDGEQTRDYVYITDVCAAMEMALSLKEPATLTIGSEESVSVNALHRLVCEVTGVDLPAEHVEARPGEMPAVVLDTSRARSAGFRPEHDLRSGLEATWADFQLHGGG